MNRLKLRIYEPPEPTAENTGVDADNASQRMTAERDILPFRKPKTRIISGRFTPPVDRARLIRENNECPECQRCNIEPIELQDATISHRNRMPIPGTATIVGFHCNDCETEWPVYDLRQRVAD